MKNEKFCVKALMTVYYPGDEQLRHAKRCARQVDELYICDNSPSDSKELFAGEQNMTYCWMRKNLGLSGAFNRLLADTSWGWKEDDWILFLDQDSVIPGRHIQKLVSTFTRLRKAGINVGCLGPVFYNKSRGSVEMPRLARRLSTGEMVVSSIITSSMLCRYGDLKSIGFWNEEIFLDMADWELCWRLRQKGYVCCMTKRTSFLHTVGEGEKRIGVLRLRVGKPFREYYETRDCLTLLKKSYTPPRYKLRFLAMLTVRPLLHLLFLDDAGQRRYYIEKGICDYRKKIYGGLANDGYTDGPDDRSA